MIVNESNTDAAKQFILLGNITTISRSRNAALPNYHKPAVLQLFANLIVKGK